MNDPEIPCTAPSCDKVRPSSHMWLPANDALMQANSGARVEVKDFPKFALCGRHGHLLRKSGVRVFRFAQSVEREETFLARRDSRKQWGTFADRFKKPSQPKVHSLIKRERNGQNVGTGLKACAKLDAQRRLEEERNAADKAQQNEKQC